LAWTPTPAECSKLLAKQLYYLNYVANNVFGPGPGGRKMSETGEKARGLIVEGALASAMAAGLTDFVMLAQL